MLISAMRYGDCLSLSAMLAFSCAAVALMIRSARTPGSIFSTMVASESLPRFAAFFICSKNSSAPVGVLAAGVAPVPAASGCGAGASEIASDSGASWPRAWSTAWVAACLACSAASLALSNNPIATSSTSRPSSGHLRGPRKAARAA
jgi:hypothetical protein